MSHRRKILIGIRSLIASLTATMALVAFAPTAAYAALNTPISGNTGSNSLNYYLSANFRTITDDMYPQGAVGYVWINIDVAPKFANGTPDGLKWRLYYNGGYHNYKVLNQAPALWVDLGFVGYPGQSFRNSFTRANDCPNCNHNFSGNMNY